MQTEEDVEIIQQVLDIYIINLIYVYNDYACIDSSQPPGVASIIPLSPTYYVFSACDSVRVVSFENFTWCTKILGVGGVTLEEE